MLDARWARLGCGHGQRSEKKKKRRKEGVWRQDSTEVVLCALVTWLGNLPIAAGCGFILNSLKSRCPGSDGVARDKAKEPRGSSVAAAGTGSQACAWQGQTH